MTYPHGSAHIPFDIDPLRLEDQAADFAAALRGHPQSRHPATTTWPDVWLNSM
jgi:hypothetical protein